MSEETTGISVEVLTEKFSKLKSAASAEEKNEAMVDIERLIWRVPVEEADRHPNLKKFVEVGGARLIQEVLQCDELENIETILNFTVEAFADVPDSNELPIALGSCDKYVDRLAAVLGKLGNQPLPSDQNTKLSTVAIKVAMGITRPLECREFLTERFLPVLKECLSDPEKGVKNEAFICVANLIGASDEPEHIELIKANESTLENVVYALAHQNTKDYTGFYELPVMMTFITNIAKNETNRKLLQNFDIVNAVLDTLKSQYRVRFYSDMLSCLDLLMYLAFDRATAESFVRNGGLDRLRDIKRNNVSNQSIIDKATEAIWMLQHKHKLCNPLAAPKLRVLLSFSCHQRDVVEQLKEQLFKHDLDVIMKGQHTQGHTLQASIDAIDSADAAVLCVSEEYSRCINCRTEAEYVSSSKPFVVAAAVSDYKPSGWLASLAAGSGSGCRSGCECEFELDTSDADKLAETAKRVADEVRQAAEADWKEPAKWDSGKVGRWLRKNGFEDAATAFEAEGIDGAALRALSEGESKYFEETAKSFGIRKIGKVLQLRFKLTQLICH